MASKRFLGLGFTFAAQDKGLEKKLKSINSLFGEISRTTTMISRKSGKLFGMASEMQKGAGSLGIGGGGRGGGGGGRVINPRPSHGQDPNQRKGPGVFMGERETHPRMVKASADNGKLLNEMAAMIAKSLEGYGPAFEKDAKRIIDKAVKTGRSVGAVVSDLTNNAEKMAESATIMGNNFKLIKMGFVYIKEWVKDIGNSVNNFMSTLGIDLREMIPKELTAAGGVLKSLARPLADFGKSLMSSLTKKGDQKVQDRLTGKVGKITSAIGDSKSLPTLQKLLAMELDVMEKAEEEQGKKSMFDKLKGWLAGIPLIGPILAGLLGGIGRLGSAIKWAVDGAITLGKNLPGIAGWLLKFVKNIGGYLTEFGGYLKMAWNSVLEGLATAVESVFEFVGGIIEYISSIGVEDIMFGIYRAGTFVIDALGGMVEFIAEVAIPVIALAGALTGFVTEIWNYKDTIIETVSVIGKLLGAVFGYASAWVQTAFAPLISVVSGFITPIFQILGKAIMAVFDIFKGFGSNIGKIVGMSFEIFNNYAKSATTDLKTATSELKNPLPQTSQPTLATVGTNAQSANDRIGALKATNDMADAQQTNVQLAQNQLDTSKQTNDLLQQMIDGKGGSPSPIPLNVQIKTDSKAFSAKVRNDEVNSASASGSGI